MKKKENMVVYPIRISPGIVLEAKSYGVSIPAAARDGVAKEIKRCRDTKVPKIVPSRALKQVKYAVGDDVIVKATGEQTKIDIIDRKPGADRNTYYLANGENCLAKGIRRVE